MTGKIRTFNMALFMLSALLVQSGGICSVHADMGRIEREKIEFQKYEPTGKFLSVLLPSGWKQQEFDFMKEHNEYEMQIYAPGYKGIEYLMIKIAFYAEASRTPQRFMYDLMNPQFNPQGEERSPLTDMVLSGRKAMSLEIKTPRSPLVGTEGKTIKSVKRYVVCPAEKGFYVLLYDSPASISEENRWVFEKILDSFDPAALDETGSEQIREIGDDEYEVLTDFFNTKKIPEIELPQFFENVIKGRSVYEKTLLGEKLDGKSLKDLEKVFGKLDSFLVEDYRRKNMTEYAIKDRILVPHLQIFLEQQRKNALRDMGTRLDRFSERRSEIIYLSSIGFSKEKNTALFYVSHAASPSTSYFVLMGKTHKKWVIKNAVIDKMIIF
jgi:hypothetical protein